MFRKAAPQRKNQRFVPLVLKTTFQEGNKMSKQTKLAFWGGMMLLAALAAILATPAQALAAQTNASPAISAWLGEYYGNRDLVGSPAMVRDDAAIDFNWGLGAPAAGLPADNFSARWTRTLYFSGGTYRFFARSDDGVRVWLNGQIIMDQWHPAPGTTYATDRTLSAGNYLIRVEYFEEGGGAQIRFWWEAPSAPSYPDWRGEYYANASLDGSPAFVRNDVKIDFAWGAGAPDSSMPADNFSIRWTRRAAFQAGTYRFHALVDGGAYLWVGNKLIIDVWHDGSAREFTADYVLNSADYDLKLEYVEGRGDARIKVWWEKVDPSFPDWKGEYWTNANLSGSPVLVQNEGRIDFDWGLGSVAAGLPVDNWSARWTRALFFEAGTYRFHIVVDDGARLWVDNQLIIDGWRDGTARELIAEYALGRGNHNLRVEFYERTGSAQMHLRWEKLVPNLTDWKGQYWSNADLKGNPTVVRNDEKIDFDWGIGAPAAGMPADNFSARWERSIHFEAGTYTFYARADNGVRFYLDGVLVVDQWRTNSERVHTFSRYLSGTHQLVVEFHEGGGPAMIQFWWE